jgi:hypothetical protein
MNGELTKGGKRYFMTFIDDCTRFCYVYLLKSKDEALNYVKIYKAEVENQLEKKIKGAFGSCPKNVKTCRNFDAAVAHGVWLAAPFVACRNPFVLF